MGLYEDSKKIIMDILGEEVAKQLDNFEDPEKYPEDFLNECIYFLSKLIGDETAKSKFQPLYKKYIKTKSNRNKGKRGTKWLSKKKFFY